MQKKIIFLILFLNLISNSFAVEKDYFMMLKYSKVNVRFGPSRDYPVKFIYKKAFLPVKVIDKKENFRKIIDNKKNSGWIHISQLKKSMPTRTCSLALRSVVSGPAVARSESARFDRVSA